MRCIIIDDELMARSIINKLCLDIEGLNILGEFNNAIEAIKFLNKSEVDLIFLDIHMPDFTGIDFIQTLKNPPKIILTTSDANFAIDAFQYDCIIDYLIKPIDEARFKKAIEKFIENYQKLVSNNEIQESKPSIAKRSVGDLYINLDRRLIKINVESIYLIEAKGDYILIKTENKNYTVHSTLKNITEKLPSNMFLKVHRSYVINVDKIIDIEDNSVLINRDVIPVSRLNRPELMKRLNLL